MATKVKKPQYTPDNPETSVNIQQPIPAEDIKELVERVDIETLKPWKENNQKHSDKDIKKLAANIATHGQSGASYCLAEEQCHLQRKWTIRRYQITGVEIYRRSLA